MPWAIGSIVLALAGRPGRLDGDEAPPLARGRRGGPGGRVVVFDGLGLSASAEVVAVDRGRVDLAIVGIEPATDLGGSLVLATAVPKGDRFDWLVEKATELGVLRLVPIRSERSVVDPRPTKLDRLRRAVIEASKQSGRSRPMEIAEQTAWADWLASGSLGAASRLLAHPGGGPVGPGLDLAAGVAVAIGPEGGFTEAEVAAALSSGWPARSGSGRLSSGSRRRPWLSAAAVVAGSATVGWTREGGACVTGAMMVLTMIGVGLGAGVVGGMFGIGGGLIIVPALMLGFGLDQKTATGTSLLAQLLGVAILAVLEYGRRGETQGGRGAGDRRRAGLRHPARGQAHGADEAVGHEATLRHLPGRGRDLFPLRRHGQAAGRRARGRRAGGGGGAGRTVTPPGDRLARKAGGRDCTIVDRPGIFRTGWGEDRMTIDADQGGDARVALGVAAPDAQRAGDPPGSGAEVERYPARVVRHTYAGVPLEIEIADQTAADWYDRDWARSAEFKEITLLKRHRLKPGARVFDVGAHQCIVALGPGRRRWADRLGRRRRGPPAQRPRRGANRELNRAREPDGPPRRRRRPPGSDRHQRDAQLADRRQGELRPDRESRP